MKAGGVHRGPELVRRHVLDRLAPEHPRAVEHAFVQEHLREAQVVQRRRRGAAAATLEFPSKRWIAYRLRPPGQRVGGQRFRDASCLFRWYGKAGVGHAERPPYPVSEKAAERLLG